MRRGAGDENQSWKNHNVMNDNEKLELNIIC